MYTCMLRRLYIIAYVEARETYIFTMGEGGGPLLLPKYTKSQKLQHVAIIQEVIHEV